MRSGSPISRRSDALIRDNQAAIVAAINADYGSRSEFETRFGEVFIALDGIHDAAKRLKGWMKPRRRRVAIR